MLDFPTHSQGSALDLIFTNFHGLIKDTMCFSSHSLKSDHLFLSFSISTPLKLAKAKRSPTFTLSFNKIDVENMASHLRHLDYNVLLSSVDIEFVWSSLKHIILHDTSLFTT